MVGWIPFCMIGRRCPIKIPLLKGRKKRMIVETYQSMLVLRKLKAGEVYRALPSISLDRAYRCLADMLGIHCECPIFGVLRFHRKCSDGKGASSVKLTLKVPNDHVWLTEYSDWAEFLFNLKYTKPYDYTRVDPAFMEECSQRKLNGLIHSIKRQKHPIQYRVPQVILEEIRPEWLVKYQAKK